MSYSIGGLSKKSGVKVPTIRYYETMGLLPEPERTSGNQRRYSEEALEKLHFIRRSRDLGFSIDDIRDLLGFSMNPDGSCSCVDELIQRHLDETRAKIEQLQALENELQRLTSCHETQIKACLAVNVLNGRASVS